jgi:hypothetical protein
VKSEKVNNRIIDTIVTIGTYSKDTKTSCKAATSLAHVTEVLNPNENIASEAAIAFMINMVKETKKIKQH